MNLGLPAVAALDALPLSRLAYVHVAGGQEHGGIWHETHTASVPEPVLDILSELCARTTPPGVLLEWDDDCPSDAALATELSRVATAAMTAGADPGQDDRPGALRGRRGGRPAAAGRGAGAAGRRPGRRCGAGVLLRLRKHPRFCV